MRSTIVKIKMSLETIILPIKSGRVDRRIYYI